MKRIITIASLALTVNAFAQIYKAIPDSNFVRYLKTIVPTAFKGDSLNTTSTLVTTTTKSINVFGPGFNDISAVQYFTSLKYLNCSDNMLVLTPPILPNSLDTLICDWIGWTNLPTLPNSLVYISSVGNNCSTLPTLPTSLKYLDVSNNITISSLPALPTTLQTIHTGSNNIACFPTFPNSINILDINPNPYNCLPNHIAVMNSTELAMPLCAAGNSNGCPVTTGIEQYTSSNEVSLYPNPASTNLTLTLSKGEGIARVNIYDVLGNEVISTKEKEIDVSGLSEGVYTLSLITNAGVVNKRVVIVR